MLRLLPTADPFPLSESMPQTSLGSTAPLPQDLLLHSDTHSGRRCSGSPAAMDGHATGSVATFILSARNGTQDRARQSMLFHNGYNSSRRQGSWRPRSTTAAFP